MASELDSIRGIGAHSKKILLRTFKSVKRMREATPKELIEAIGEARAKILMNYFASTAGAEKEETNVS